ncbi:MAG: type II toxin-antitoxin system PemK/MazF family toxin [candidate division NC10 bacterium]|nr:type II toxin-antitoxin system PemK/MazF family toxin [candidate division NC10 bacterium]MBI2454971.1 type II toxin-antitoxin system PemK/MazF family toxin [candidate division NC10 bacterium]
MRRGTVVLTPFPFTDLSGAKVRPAVVVSRSDRPGDDVILAFVSSVVPPRPPPTDLAVDPSHPNFRETNGGRSCKYAIPPVPGEILQLVLHHHLLPVVDGVDFSVPRSVRTEGPAIQEDVGSKAH